MTKRKDQTGKKSGRLTAVKFVGVAKDGHALWDCVCKCGKHVVISSNKITCGTVKSCGCLSEEVHLKHGFSRRGMEHPLYRIWAGMKGRCTNPNGEGYKNYGGRGISMCDAWLNDPSVFILWAIKNKWEPGLAIDRKDNNNHYSPSNCHFVRQIVNSQNQRLLRSDNTTGFRGVSFVDGRYYATCSVRRKRYSLGGFSDPVSAAINRDWFAAQMSTVIPLNFSALRRA